MKLITAIPARIGDNRNVELAAFAMPFFPDDCSNNTYLSPKELENRQLVQRLQQNLTHIQIAAAIGRNDPNQSKASCAKILEILRTLN